MIRTMLGIVVWLSCVSVSYAQPAPPTGLLSGQSGSQMVLGWNSSPGAVEYKVGLWIYNNNDGGIRTPLIAQEGSGPREGYWLQGYFTTTTVYIYITPAYSGRLYGWHVKAKNSAGQWSGWSHTPDAAHWLGSVNYNVDISGAEFYYANPWASLGMPTVSNVSAPASVQKSASFTISGNFTNTTIMMVGLLLYGSTYYAPLDYAFTNMTGASPSGSWSILANPTSDLQPGYYYQVVIFAWNPFYDGDPDPFKTITTIYTGRYVYVTN